MKISGHEFEILKMTGGRDIDRALLVEAAAKITNNENGDEYSFGEQVMRITFYPSLSVCAKGDVPSEKEFLEMAAEDVEKWLNAFELENPNHFSKPDTEEQLKKKET